MNLLVTLLLVKLKQKIATGLCALYVVSVIGIAMSLHFCGGKLADVSLYAKTACEFCKNEPIAKKDDGCCKNTKVEVKVKDSHQVETSFKLAKLFSFDTYFPSRITELFRSYLPALFNKLENKAPPRTSQISLQILHCVFRN